MENLRILIIGDIKNVFTNYQDVKAMKYPVYEDVLDGIEAASRQAFAGIGVELGENFGSACSALKTLRQVNGGAKIIVLAKMYEEPLARRLVQSGSQGGALADDYLICPAHISHLSSLIRRLSKEGDEVTVSMETVPEREETKGSRTDLETVERIRRLEKLATEDDLTGLKNRRYIWEFSRQIIERAKSYNGRVTLLIFDIDDFKHYNDRFGHKTGDDILKEAAELMKRCCRSHDVVGRIGGDEFAVIFWDIPQARSERQASDRRTAVAEHPREVLSIAKRFSGELQKSHLPSLGSAGKGVLTISGGLASFPDDGESTAKLFEQADKALLDAKRSGKNRIYLVGRPNEDITQAEKLS
jgi:diguanylate cyclase (GGDEF)-like protein